jgi:hypothetical protein
LEVLGQTVSAARKVDEEKALQERQAAQQLLEQITGNMVRLNAAQNSSVIVPGQDIARFLAESFGLQLNIPAPPPSLETLDIFKVGPSKPSKKDASPDKT